jgi:hypothetical protein
MAGLFERRMNPASRGDGGNMADVFCRLSEGHEGTLTEMTPIEIKNIPGREFSVADFAIL